MTLHPRVYTSPANFSAMVLPFWLFMTRNLYVDPGDVSLSTTVFFRTSFLCFFQTSAGVV